MPSLVGSEMCIRDRYRIYPGKGSRYVAKDGRVVIFITKKAGAFFLRKIQAQNIRWTTAWRRANKKMKTEGDVKKRRKRNVKIQKAIVGISLDEIKRKRAEKPEQRKAQQDQALREIKERRQKVTSTKKGTGAGKAAPAKKGQAAPAQADKGGKAKGAKKKQI
eukprot:TRINITY_DN4553_c0_g1_i1.p1 TRINITY_DN4553_c0_g1~~TRINITY_DN4553_c0_g1_i1.p1  ORF type:complete len:163 (-),score=82.62 TRINITY_DN4553_c0_g1_i1:206-694(-)